jgi:hypothetical protein
MFLVNRLGGIGDRSIVRRSISPKVRQLAVFYKFELRTLSTWHNNQQVDGGHYEAETEKVL